MTARTNSRVAGIFFLFYIATGITDLILENKIRVGETATNLLSNLAQHAGLFRIATALTLLTTVDALVLAVAIYGLTHDYDRDLAILALVFRVGEGIVAAVAAVNQTRLLAIATGNIGADGNQIAASLRLGSSSVIGAFLFAAGSTLYCYIFLRARNIPLWLAWTGFVGSLLLVLCLPLQLLDLLHRPVTDLVWIPVAIFEIVFGIWLLARGVQPATTSQPRLSES